MKWFGVFFIFVFIACQRNSQSCVEWNSPYIYFVGFDSTDFDSITIEQYPKFSNFTNKLQTYTVNMSNQISNKDTIFLDFYWSPIHSSPPKYYADPAYNWLIRFKGNQTIQFGNVRFYKSSREYVYDYIPDQCAFLSFTIETSNCTFNSEVGIGKGIFIHK